MATALYLSKKLESLLLPGLEHRGGEKKLVIVAPSNNKVECFSVLYCKDYWVSLIYVGKEKI